MNDADRARALQLDLYDLFGRWKQRLETLSEKAKAVEEEEVVRTKAGSERERVLGIERGFHNGAHHALTTARRELRDILLRHDPRKTTSDDDDA